MCDGGTSGVEKARGVVKRAKRRTGRAPLGFAALAAMRATGTNAPEALLELEMAGSGSIEVVVAQRKTEPEAATTRPCREGATSLPRGVRQNFYPN